MKWTDPFDPLELDVLRADAGTSRTSRPDARAAWASLTGFAGLKSPTGEGHAVEPGDLVAVLCEAQSPEDIKAILAMSWLTVPAAYAAPVRSALGQATFFTARLKRGDLHRLNTCPGLVAWQLGLANVPASSGKARAGGTAGLFAHVLDATPPQPTMGVIDFGLAFLHHQFRGPSAWPSSRVRALWDQGLSPGSVSRWTSASMGYGRELPEGEIDTLVGTGDELAAYRDLRYLQEVRDGYADMAALNGSKPLLPVGTRDVLPWTHGTHVTHVAAGCSDPSRGQAQRDRAGDAASRADIAFVQLPMLTAYDSSGASLGVHVLDGIRYILDIAHAKAPLVVNISFGAHAGPHDGTSMIERAMDELLTLGAPDFAITLGAGNGRQARGHARVQLPAGGSTRLRWKLSPGDVTDSFVELWHSPGSNAAQSGTGLGVRLVDPRGRASPWVVCGRAAALRDATGACVAAVVHMVGTSNGADPLVLVALRPNACVAGASGDALSLAGTWVIEMANFGTSTAMVHGYIERDEAPLRGEAAPSVFLDGVVEGGTLSSLATGARTMVVGARRRAGRSYRLNFSGVGRARGGSRASTGPDVLVPCDDDEAHPGLVGAAVRSGDTVRMSGTSVAAPALARSILNEMVAHPAGAWRGTLGGRWTAPASSPTPSPAAGAAAAPGQGAAAAPVDTRAEGPEPPSWVP